MFKLHFLVFFLVFILIYVGLHYYVYTRVAVGLNLSGTASIYLGLFFIIGAISFFVGELLTRQSTNFMVKPIAEFGSIWLGVISIALSVFIIADILRIFFHGESFRYYSVIVSLIVIFLVSAYSVYNVIRPDIIKELKIKIDKLPSKLSGFTIVQFSDVHLHLLKSSGWLNGIIEKTNGLNPDLIVITGDLIDADLSRSDEFCYALNRLKSKYGVYAITGNHEYYAGVDKFLKIAKMSNIKVLRNEKTTIAGAIELAGVDDKTGKTYEGIGTRLNDALKDCDFKKPVILLSHQPDVFDEAAKAGVDLQLSGHVHAGQIPPMDLIVMFYFKYPYGLYHKGRSFLYTTSGTGTWGPPMRFFSRSEIVKIVLE